MALVEPLVFPFSLFPKAIANTGLLAASRLVEVGLVGQCWTEAFEISSYSYGGKANPVIYSWIDTG